MAYLDIGGELFSSLLEVMVAVIVAGVLIASLAGVVASAAAQAANVRGQADDLGGRSLDPEMMGAWEWGGLTISAEWLPGPVLRLSTRAAGAENDTPSLGLWVDGWFQGEWPVNSSGAAEIEAETWSGYEGHEAVIRVRTPETCWGPPWRSLVADAAGVVAIATTSGSAGGSHGEETIVHPPNAGNPAVEVSWAGMWFAPESFLPIVAGAPAAGPAGVTLDESLQSWLMEVGRGLDVYF